VLNMDWNALRGGDDVLVHDPRSPEMALTAGVVAVFDRLKRTNGVGIRLAAKDGHDLVLWPSRLVVHPNPRDPTEPCWRCQELAERAQQAADTPPREASRPTSVPPRPGMTVSGSPAVEATATA
jgi:hypothetical protein